MQGLAGPVGSGIPNAYPIAVNTPLDRAYLRPLQEPLYDSEIIPCGTDTTTNSAFSLVFYQRPYSQNTQYPSASPVSKTEAETNINQSSMLDYPREFSILGFTVSLDSTIGLQFQGALLRRAFFQFIFSGRRPYLQIPLDRLPAGIGLEGAVGLGNVTDSTYGEGVITCFKQGLGHIANYYKFNLGRSALKIKPGEAFNAKITWPVGPTTGSNLLTKNNFYGVTPGTYDSAPGGFWMRVASIGLNLFVAKTGSKLAA